MTDQKQHVARLLQFLPRIPPTLLVVCVELAYKIGPMNIFQHCKHMHQVVEVEVEAEVVYMVEVEEEEEYMEEVGEEEEYMEEVEVGVEALCMVEVGVEVGVEALCMVEVEEQLPRQEVVASL